MTSRKICDAQLGPLFNSQPDQADLASGKVYVLRSKSEHPTIRENRNILHKIGITGGDVNRRIANARLDPTFLMADVEVVATYELFNINRSKLENLIQALLCSTGYPDRRQIWPISFSKGMVLYHYPQSTTL